MCCHSVALIAVVPIALGHGRICPVPTQVWSGGYRHHGNRGGDDDGAERNTGDDPSVIRARHPRPDGPDNGYAPCAHSSDASIDVYIPVDVSVDVRIPVDVPIPVDVRV